MDRRRSSRLDEVAGGKEGGKDGGNDEVTKAIYRCWAGNNEKGGSDENDLSMLGRKRRKGAGKKNSSEFALLFRASEFRHAFFQTCLLSMRKSTLTLDRCAPQSSCILSHFNQHAVHSACLSLGIHTFSLPYYILPPLACP